MGGMCMRTLLILLALFIPCTLMKAEEPIDNQVENIDLHLNDHEAVVTFLGLSEGEAVLLQAANGKNILINMGGKGTRAELEEGLSLYDVKEISTLFLTNDDVSLDKIKQLISSYKIKEIITTSEISAQLTNELKTINHIPILAWGAGTKKEILPDMTAEVEFVGEESNEGMDLKLQFFNHTIFLMSSNSPRAEQVLMKKNLRNVNVFKIPNCSMEGPLSEQLIQYLNPEISILFEGNNGMDTKTLRDLNEIWSEVYSTKKHGTVTVKFTENNYEVIRIPVKLDE
jgi:competence protein ComEC